MPAVQGANPDGEREVKGSLALAKNKIFDRHAAVLQLACCEFGCRACNGLRNGLGGTVDGQNVALTDALEHSTCSDARTAANFQNTHARAKRQRCNEFSEAW